MLSIPLSATALGVLTVMCVWHHVATCIGPELINHLTPASAPRYGTVLENVVFDPATREVDYSSDFLTENTRACYPIESIDNSKIPCVGGHPKNIIMLTCDVFGVLPPVSKLSPEQAMYHFIAGYTSKVRGVFVCLVYGSTVLCMMAEAQYMLL